MNGWLHIERHDRAHESARTKSPWTRHPAVSALLLGLFGTALTANAAPTAGNYTAVLDTGPSLNVNVLGNVSVSGGAQIDPGSLAVVTAPAHGTAVVADGEVFYTANTGFSGTDTFKFTVADTAKSVSNVATATVNVSLPATPYTPVLFGTFANLQAIASPGNPAPNGPMKGYAYSSTNLGSSVNFGGETFRLGAADGKDALSRTTVNVAQCQTPSFCPFNDLRPLRYSSVKILATGVNGPQQNQDVCLTYYFRDQEPPFVKCSKINFSDWRTPQNFAGESIAATVANRTTPTGTLQAGPWYVYEYEIPVDPSRMLMSIATPPNANVIVLAMNLEPVATPTARPSDMGTNLVASSSGTLLPSGGPAGLGGRGDTYDTSLLGSSVVSQGVAFRIVSPFQETSGATALTRSSANLVDTINYVPEYGFFSKLYLLGTGYNGDQINQPVVINYADGSKVTTLLSFSDWRIPAHFPGETTAITSAYRWHSYATKQNGPWYAYSYSVPVDRTKKVASVTLPNADVAILGITLLP